mmetsp:Transcript_17900/g.28579  ORF Transcript_17900/g.28579 Transcript_17900/m.28579 type:complete len:104 (+) Transcript_17900:125-436(+)
MSMVNKREIENTLRFQTAKLNVFRMSLGMKMKMIEKEEKYEKNRNKTQDTHKQTNIEHTYSAFATRDFEMRRKRNKAIFRHVEQSEHIYICTLNYWRISRHKK